ncbi:MAG: hypothetical protein R3B39_00285 [Candidatus Paceibacterota bacterium]
MRTFLSKFLLLMFVAVFSVPASLFAQTENNWTAPTGAPTIGTNTPSPINIGAQDQFKQGGIGLGGGLNVRGGAAVNVPFIADDSANGQNNFFMSYVPSYFTNMLNVGLQNSPSELNIFGRLRFKPTSGSAQPQAGSVLKSADTDGNVTWGPGIPDGGEDGDTLIWDVDCQCWVTGPVTVNPGGPGLPPGTAGQTMWYNGATNQWEATDRIKHDTISSPAIPRTIVTNNIFQVDATTSYIGRNNLGATQISSDITKIISNLTDISSTNIVLGDSNTDNLTVSSGNTVFGQFTPSQNVTFNSSAVKFKGPISNPSLLDAGPGRIPMSMDIDGTFKWNKNLTYNLIPFAPGLNIGSLELANPTEGIGVFSNQGLSMLQGDTYVGTGGDLYLEGLDGASYSQWVNGSVKHLCYIEGSFKVVMCPPSGTPGEDAPTVPGTTTPIGVSGPAGDGTIMFTSEDNGSQYNFNFSGTVTIKYCGAGGGGGGGGIGAPGNPNLGQSPNNIGTGGSGGGGGAAGDCSTEDVDVVPGDVLTWNIGYGGNGGGGAEWTSGGGTNIDNNAYFGQAGGNTAIFFDPTSGPEAQVGPTVNGGLGGGPGGSVRQGLINGLPAIGTHANLALSTGAYNWGFNGQSGATPNSNPSCVSCGGIGGWGESYDTNGDLRLNLNGSQTSARGGGGTPGGTDSYSDRLGKNGYCGSPRHGGGGGGGGYGGYYNMSPFTFSFKGGRGGCGGSGYVIISGLPTTSQAGEIVFDTPGQHSLSTFQINNVIPAGVENFTIELWGAGGGAGGVYTGSNNKSGAGGSGEYQKINISRTNLVNPTLQFTVGAKGANGTSGSSPVPGERGGTTRLTGSSSALAEGGWGGYGGNLFNTTIPLRYGKGGGWMYTAGNVANPEGTYTTANSSTYNRGQEGAAAVSGSATGPCNLASESITTTLGFGNGAPRTCSDPTQNIYQGTAQNGRIRISW